MSDESPNTPSTPGSPADDFPKPSHFVLEPIPDGAYQKGLPTITAVYLGCKETPEPSELMFMAGCALDLHESKTDHLLLHLFIPPPEDEELTETSLMVSDTAGFELSSAQKTIDDFWECMIKVKAFTFAVSCDHYYFRCRVNFDSTEVTDTHCDYRLLH